MGNFMKQLQILMQKWETPLLIAILTVYEIICYHFILLKSGIKGDETHFYDTAVAFSKDFSWRHILHYDELITPFTFICYGLWGKFFGTDLQALRLLSLLIGFTTHFLFFRFLKFYFHGGLLLWLLFFLWIFNPYNIGFNAFIYTDGLSNLCMVAFLLALVKERYFLLAGASFLLIFTRQYNILVVLAGVLMVFWTLLRYKKMHWAFFLCFSAALAGISPLFLLWKGFSPPGSMTDKLAEVPRIFYLKSLPVYIYCIFVYTLPLSAVLFFKRRTSWKRLALIASFSAIFYFLFPVSASYIAVKDGFLTVGLFDKVLSAALPNLLKHMVLLLSFLGGSFMLCILIEKAFESSDRRGVNRFFQQFSAIYILLFLIAMVFNFQIWEKYFIQILPVVLVLLGGVFQKDGGASVPDLPEDIQ